MEKYYWRSRKPHRRPVLQLDETGTRVVGRSETIILPNEIFEPTPGELACFGDLLEPVATGRPKKDMPHYALAKQAIPDASAPIEELPDA